MAHDHSIPTDSTISEDPLTSAVSPTVFVQWAEMRMLTPAAPPGGLVTIGVPDGWERALVGHLESRKRLDELVSWQPPVAFLICPSIDNRIDLRRRAKEVFTGLREEPVFSLAIQGPGQSWLQVRDAGLHLLATAQSEAEKAALEKAHQPRKPWRSNRAPIDWDRIKSDIDMYPVVSRRVKLDRAGPRLFKGLCPFHEDHHTPSLVVYPGPKTAGGHAYCFGCKTYWDAVSFVHAFDHCASMSEAAQKVLSEYDPSAPVEIVPVRWVDNTWGEWKIPAIRSEVYAELWKQLSLLPRHREALQRRGLAGPDIDQAGFRSMPPWDERTGWWRKLGRDSGTLYGVPGFSQKDDGHLHGPMGLLVPVRSVNQELLGAQIRPDVPRGAGKYIWLSTPEDDPRYPGGASSGSPPHMAWPNGLPRSVPLDTLFITEGVLKATIAAAALHEPVIGVAGIGRFNAAQPLIEHLCPQVVILAYDADVWVDPNKTTIALNAIDAFQKNPAITPEAVWLAVWNVADGKGIDDITVAQRPFDVVRPEEFDPIRDALAERLSRRGETP